jgi:SAM-dependent methyltransferase
VIEDDVTRLVYERGRHYYDIAVMFEVIEHLERPTCALRAIKRVLKDDGALLISTPNSKITSPDGIVRNPYHYREYDLVQFLSLLNYCGYTVEAVYGQRWQWTPRIKIARKAYKAIFQPWRFSSPKVTNKAWWGQSPEYFVVVAGLR